MWRIRTANLRHIRATSFTELDQHPSGGPGMTETIDLHNVR